jgi:hypothetical protein
MRKVRLREVKKVGGDYSTSKCQGTFMNKKVTSDWVDPGVSGKMPPGPVSLETRVETNAAGGGCPSCWAG